MGPVRLRPMGWLDDLLPLRPPSLWSGKSLYARSLRWQPDTADLSWLFDAYAMLGIELPPPRIEHRSHQRTQRRGGGRSGRQQLRRQRAPIKGGKRPLVVPQWSKPQTMRGPSQTSTSRVETTTSTKSVSLARNRPSGGLPNVPNFQWRSPQSAEGGSGRVSPNLLSAPTFLQGVSPGVPETRPVSARKSVDPELDEGVQQNKKSPRQLEPSAQRRVSRPDAPEWKRPQSTAPQVPVLGATPSTFLKKEGVDPEPQISTSPRRAQPNVVLPHQRATTKVLGTTALNESVPASPRAQRVPASRLPPKVTWKPTHQRSPWRLHPSDRPTIARSNEASIAVNVPERQPSKRSVVEAKSSVETRWRLPLGIQAPPKTRSWTTDSPVESSVDGSVQQTGTEDKQIPVSSRVQSVSLRDSKGQRWRLQHSAGTTTNPSMVLQPLATVQRQFLDITSVSDTSIEQPSKSKSTSIPSVQEPSTKNRSTSRLEKSTPERQRRKSVVEPRKPESRSTIRTSTPRNVDVSPPIINWRPSIQPVRWRLLRTGESDSTTVTSTKTVRITPPITQRTSTHLIAPTTPEVEQTPSPRAATSEDVSKLKVPHRSDRTEVEPKSTTSKPKSEAPQGVLSRVGNVRIPSRVPWGLTPTDRTSLRPIQRGGVVPQSLVGSTEQTVSRNVLRPSSERVETKSVPSVLPPKIASWHPPRRQELIEHFRRPRLQVPITGTTVQSRPTSESLSESPTVVPTYSFARAENRSLFRAQEQSMVMPLHAGTMVFPTPDAGSSSESPKTRSSVEASAQSNVRKDVVASASSDSSVKDVALDRSEPSTKSIGLTKTTTSRTLPKGKYPPAYVQSSTGYQRRTVGSALSLVERAIRQLEAKENNESIRSVLGSVRSQIAQPRWRLPQVSFQGRTVVEARNAERAEDSRNVVRPTWTTAPQWTPQQSVRTQLLIPSDIPDRPESTAKQTSGPQRTARNVLTESRTPVRISPNRVKDASVVSGTSKKNVGPTLRRDVQWKRPSFAVPTLVSNPRTEPAARDASGTEQSRIQPKGGSERIQQVSWRLPPRFQDPFVARPSLGEAASPSISSRSTVRMQSIGLSPSLVYQPIRNDFGQESPSLSKAQSTETESLDVQEVVKHLERQVRRLPKSQRALLRSQIALPTQWISKVGGVTPQVVRNVIRTQQDVFVTKQDGAVDESNVDAVSGNPRQTKTLTTGQINRIVERQVEFFRSAQRQSFLRGSQMGGGTGGISSPARSGLQSVTQEMRTALQRMVLSTSQEQVLLDAVEQGLEQEVQRQNRRTQRDAPTQQRVPRSFSGLSKRRIRPSWRPNLHTVQPNNRPSTPSMVAPSQSETYLDDISTQQASEQTPTAPTRSVPVSSSRPKQHRGRTPSMVQPMRMMGKSDIGTFVRPKKPATPEELVEAPKFTKQDPTKIDRQSEVIMIDPSGKLLTGEAATKRLTEMGFARSEPTKPKETPTPSSGSYTWEAPPDVMDEMMQQVRQQMAAEETQEVSIRERRKTSRPRQSVIQEWTEEQLLSILVELSSDSPEANALLRDVQERVEEYFDLERFRRI